MQSIVPDNCPLPLLGDVTRKKERPGVVQSAEYQWAIPFLMPLAQAWRSKPGRRHWTQTHHANGLDAALRHWRPTTSCRAPVPGIDWFLNVEPKPRHIERESDWHLLFWRCETDDIPQTST
ncbi:hypothetical protein CGRA01v4_06259 [Colletotrichum graminicola]|nr:hypothetical protein CGRA01v4_06259 [Colletotrichum graminicola]